MGQSGSTLCLEPACLHASSHIIQNLAQNWEKIDPCTNFYEMACGGAYERWEDDTRALTWIQDRIDRILRTVIEAPYEQAAEYKSILVRNNIDEQNHRILQQDYRSCMNVEAIAEAGPAPLRSLIADFAQVWPINPEDTAIIDSSEYQDLHNAIIFLEQFQIPTFRAIVDLAGDVKVTVPDYRDPVVTLPYVTGPIFEWPLYEYQDEEKVQRLAGYIAKVFASGFYPQNISQSQVTNLAMGVADFERRLAYALAAARAEDEAMIHANPEDPVVSLSPSTHPYPLADEMKGAVYQILIRGIFAYCAGIGT